MRRQVVRAAAVLAVLSTSRAASATPLLVPGLPISVAGTDVFSGPTFTVSGNFGALDTLTLEAIGTVDLAGGQFLANAAGIIVGPSTTNTGNHPGETAPTSGNPTVPYAALLLGNSTLGFHPVFSANAANGLGSLTAPTDITETRTLGDVFGNLAVTISNGTVLEFRISDINTGDNNGGLRLLQPAPTGTAAAVPEPATGVLLITGLAVARLRARRRTTAA